MTSKKDSLAAQLELLCCELVERLRTAAGDEVAATYKSRLDELKSNRVVLPDVEIPRSLDNEEFRQKWQEWIAYRRQSRRSLSPLCLGKQLKMLAEIGMRAAIQSIDESIQNGWIGLFRPKNKVLNGPGQRYQGGNDVIGRL